MLVGAEHVELLREDDELRAVIGGGVGQPICDREVAILVLVRVQLDGGRAQVFSLAVD